MQFSLQRLLSDLYCFDFRACALIAEAVRGLRVLRAVLFRFEDLRVVFFFLRGFIRLVVFAFLAIAESERLTALLLGFLREEAAFLPAAIAERCAEAAVLPERFAFLNAALKARVNFDLVPLLRRRLYAAVKFATPLFVLRAVDFFVDLRAVDLRAVDLRAIDLRAVDLRRELAFFFFTDLRVLPPCSEDEIPFNALFASESIVL